MKYDEHQKTRAGLEPTPTILSRINSNSVRVAFIFLDLDSRYDIIMRFNYRSERRILLELFKKAGFPRLIGVLA